MASALAALTRDNPSWILIDDAHLLDPLSAAMVLQLVVNRRAGVIVTLRHRAPAADAITALWKDSLLTRIEIPPLTADDTNELLCSVLGGPIVARHSQALWWATRGNPLYLRLLVTGQLDSGQLTKRSGLWQWSGTVGVTPALEEIVGTHIGFASAAARQALELLALADRLPAEKLVELTSADAVDDAAAVGLVEVDADSTEVRLSHPLFSDVLLARMGAVRARRERARIVDALIGPDLRPLDLLRIAALALESVRKPDPDLYTAGAAIANSLGDVGLARRLGRASVAAGGSFAAQFHVAAAASILRQNVAAELQTLADLSANSEQHDHAILLLIAALSWNQPDVIALDRVLSRETALPPKGNATPAIRAAAALVQVQRGDLAAGASTAQELLEDFDVERTTVLYAGAALAASKALRGDLHNLSELVNRALVAGGQISSDLGLLRLPLLGTHQLGLLLAGRLSEAHGVTSTAKAMVTSADATAVVLGYLEGAAAAYLGDLIGAEARLRDAYAAAFPFGNVGGWLQMVSATLAICFAWQGRPGEASDLVAQAKAIEHPILLFMSPLTTLADAVVAAAEGAVSRAGNLAQQAMDQSRSLGATALEAYACQVCLLVAGQVDPVRLGVLSRTVAGPRIGLIQRYEHALRGRRADELLQISIEWENIGDRIASADASAHAATMAIEIGESQSYVAQLRRRARELAAGCGGLSTPAFRQLETPLPLTRREREVVELIAGRIVQSRSRSAAHYIDSDRGGSCPAGEREARVATQPVPRGGGRTATRHLSEKQVVTTRVPTAGTRHPQACAQPLRNQFEEDQCRAMTVSGQGRRRPRPGRRHSTAQATGTGASSTPGSQIREPRDDPATAQTYDIQRKYNDAGGEAVFGKMHGNPHVLATFWECDHGYIVADADAPGGAYAVYGSIYDRYRELGGPRSYLGQPTSDEVDFDGGRASGFQHGGIYWWPGAGAAIDLRGVRVAYTGMYCEDQTDPEVGDDDEPYAVIGWIANTVGEVAAGSVTTAVYGDVDDGSARPDLLEFYNGAPYGISISVTVVEEDEGDPNRYREQINQVMQANHEIGQKALHAIPVVGPFLAETLGPVLGELVPVWTDAINAIAGNADDLVGSRTITLSPRDMVMKAARENNREWQSIGYKFETGNISGSGGTYNVYFGIVPA